MGTLFTKLDTACYGRPMTTTSIIQYILLVLLVIFTVFNFYNLTAGKKRRKAAQNEFKRTLALLEQDAMKVVKKEKVAFETKIGYMNDQGQGILLTFDKEHELLGIFLSGEHHIIRKDEFVSAKQRYEQCDGKKITNIVVEVETTSSVLAIIFGTREYRPTGYLGKFILSDSEEFATRVTEHLRPPL